MLLLVTDFIPQLILVDDLCIDMPFDRVSACYGASEESTVTLTSMYTGDIYFDLAENASTTQNLFTGTSIANAEMIKFLFNLSWIVRCFGLPTICVILLGFLLLQEPLSSFFYRTFDNTVRREAELRELQEKKVAQHIMDMVVDMITAKPDHDPNSFPGNLSQPDQYEANPKDEENSPDPNKEQEESGKPPNPISGKEMELPDEEIKKESEDMGLGSQTETEKENDDEDTNTPQTRQPLTQSMKSLVLWRPGFLRPERMVNALLPRGFGQVNVLLNLCIGYRRAMFEAGRLF